MDEREAKVVTAPVPSSQPERLSRRARAGLAAARAAKKVNRWVGVALNVAGLAGFAGSVLTLFFAGSVAQAITAAALAVVAIGAASLAVMVQVRAEHDQIDARGAVALRKAHDPLARAANALAFATSSLLDDEDPKVFRIQAHEFARELAQAYTQITDATCRVTVKHTYDVEESGDAAVRTLFSSDPDFVAQVPSGVDLVKENTDFAELLEDARKYWVSQDVTEEPGYINSHYSREDILEKRVRYRSVMVWPIQTVTAEGPQDADIDLLGFLCVDSPEVGIFDEKRDVSPGEIFSHALHSSLRLYKRRITRGVDEEAEEAQ